MSRLASLRPVSPASLCPRSRSTAHFHSQQPAFHAPRIVVLLYFHVLANSSRFPKRLSPVFSTICALFQKEYFCNSFLMKRLRTLLQNTRVGGGVLLAAPPCLVSVICLSLFVPLARGQQSVPDPGQSAQIQVYQSSEELHETLQEKPALTFGSTRGPNLTITVNDAVRYQQIDGFGASLTDSSAWLLWNKLTEPQRKEVLQMLFSPTKGIGLSILRQPMGASDFALSDYSYDDLPPAPFLGQALNQPPGQGSGQASMQSDPQLQHFSIDHDRAYIIPILREALALNPNLKI